MKSAIVDSRDGSVALYIDGQKVPPVLLGLSDIPGAATNTAYAQKTIRQFAEAGVTLLCADSDLRLGWHKVSPFECEPIREEIAAAQLANPDVGIILRLHMNPPYFWLRDNPDECVLYADKDGVGHAGLDDGEHYRTIYADHQKHMRVSLASEKWLREAGEHLRTFCENIWNTREGEALVGIQVACGVNGEWHGWGADCSKPMERRFRRYLYETYGTKEALREAWGDPTVTFESARFNPSPEQNADEGIFRHPTRSRAITDAQRALQTAVPEAILHFCRIIKESFGRPILTGAFYGYYMGTGGDLLTPIEGHLRTDLIYKNRDLIDFLCAPAPYRRNRQFAHAPMQRGLLEANRVRDMLWLTEMDEHPVGTELYIGGDPERIGETIAKLRRDVMLPILAGQGLWYYDHRVVFRHGECKNPYCSSLFRKFGWWDNPKLLREIKMMQELARKSLEKPYRPEADVLFVYAPESEYAVAHYVKKEEKECMMHDAVSRAGVAYDVIYDRELDACELDRYRCVFFPNAYALTPDAREKMRKLTEGKTRVWFYAAGYSDGRTLSTENISATVGLHIERTDECDFAYTAADGEHVEDADIAPYFYVSDTDAEVLARFPSGRVAAAKKGDDVYFALPLLDRANAKKILAAAGAHSYCTSGESVLAGGGMVMLCTPLGGERTLLLRSGKEISLTLPPMTTAIFDAESGERLDISE